VVHGRERTQLLHHLGCEHGSEDVLEHANDATQAVYVILVSGGGRNCVWVGVRKVNLQMHASSERTQRKKRCVRVG
jgi:hypothetical protein